MNFFISYAGPDKAWAEWIAWQLEEFGYSTVLQAWDFRPGSNFVVAMEEAARDAEHTIAVLSSAYLDHLFTQAEWAAAFARDPTGKARALVPVRVSQLDQDPGILAQVTYIDLVGLDEDPARRALLDGVSPQQRIKPSEPPVFPGSEMSDGSVSKAFPGLASEAGSGTRRRRLGRFIHSQVTAHGLLDLDLFGAAYPGLDDPTAYGDTAVPVRVYASVWVPGVQTLARSPLQPLTAVTAICTFNPVKVVDDFFTCPEHPGVTIPLVAPSQLRNEEKERLMRATSYALRDSLVVAVTIPALMLGVGRANPDVAYQAIADLLLLPILETHRKLQFQQFHAHISDVGEANKGLQGIVKRVIRCAFPKKGCWGAEIVARDSIFSSLDYMGRLIAWAVGAFYNSGKSRWLQILREP